MLSEYQEQTKQTDVMIMAPDRSLNQKLTYYLKGILSECGELLTASSYRDKGLEFGDITWYLARFCDEWGKTTFEDVYRSRIDVDALTVPVVMLVSAAKLADALKKWERDGDNDTARKEKFKNDIEYGLCAILSSAFSYMKHEARLMGDDRPDDEFINSLLRKNLDKLNARKAANTIQGTGDNR